MRTLVLAILCFCYASSQELTTTPTVFCTPNKCGPRGKCVESAQLCLCPTDLAGAYCQINVCQNTPTPKVDGLSKNENQCLDIQTPTVIAPADTEISCAATDIRPSALGVPFISDNCGTSSSNLRTNSSDKVLRRSTRSDCPNAFIIERTFQATDRCDNTARDSQRIFVDDTQSPTIRARFIALPALTKSMNGVGFGKVLSNLDAPTLAGLGVSLGVLLDAARRSGIDPAVLLSALSGNDGKSNSDLSSILSRLGGSNGNSGKLMDLIRPQSSDSMDSMSKFSTVPSLSSNGQNTNTQGSQVSGVATCNPPEIRAFVLQCNISDDCSSRNNIQFAARLRVTHITNRNAFFVAATHSMPSMPAMPMKPMAVESDGWVVSKTGVENMMNGMNMDNMMNNMNMNNMNMNMDKGDIMHKLESMGPGIFKNGDKVITVVGDRWGDKGGLGTTMTGDSWSNMNMGMGGVGTTIKGDSWSNMNMGMGGKGDSWSNMNMGGMNMGNMGGMNMGGMNTGGMNMNMNMGMMDKGKRVDFSGSLFPEGPSTTPITGSSDSTECLTATDFVDVKCGDTVLIQLDREDSCLANDFVAGSPFLEGKSLGADDFGGSELIRLFLAKFGLSSLSSSFSSNSGSSMLFDNNGFAAQAAGKILAVRGTSVQAQVRAVDECNNRETVWLDISDQPCDTFVAGRCCPPVAATGRVVNQQRNSGPLSGSPFDMLRKPM